jgi:Fic family protein
MGKVNYKMDPSNFTEKATGKVVEVSGVQGLTHAFIPDPLPPKWEWPVELWPALLGAREELARLDGIGIDLPNPHLLLVPLQHREAQRSSSLEGTYATPEQLVLFEINPAEVENSGEKEQPIREVMNYSKALRLRLETKETLPVSLRLIRELHRVLLSDVRGSKAEPGEFRRSQVQVGSDGRYVPPPANYLPDCLDNFEKYLHQDRKIDPLVDAFLAHYQFEAIHPFRDGNGRVGRLLLSITIEDWCGLSGQWLYMSAYFDKYKAEYIDHLYKITTEGDWTGWIDFCLRGVALQALDAQKRCSRLLRLRDEYHKRLDKACPPPRVYQLMEDLFIRPFTTAPWIKEKLGITYPTAHSYLDQLVDLGILSDIKLRLRRQKAYLCKDIFNITYEDIATLQE